MSLMKDGIINNIANILLITLCEKEHGLCVALWRTEETLTIRVFPETFKNCSNCTGQLCKTFGSLRRSFFKTVASADAFYRMLVEVVNAWTGSRDSLGRLRPSKSISGLGDLVPTSKPTGDASSLGSLAAFERLRRLFLILLGLLSLLRFFLVPSSPSPPTPRFLPLACSISDPMADSSVRISGPSLGFVTPSTNLTIFVVALK
jgi:hypothetical protein